MRIVYMRAFVPALLFAFISLGIGNAQKITIDPYASNAVSNNTLSAGADMRLTRKITYEARHKSVKDVLADLSEQSNVVLNAGYSKQDWQVRDRKMIIFARDISLAELMSSIARVMKFKWSINSQVDPPTYRLIADRKLIAKMQMDQQRKDKELKAEVSRRRQGFIDAMTRVNQMSETEIEALAQENPYLYLTAKNGCAKLTEALFNEVPGLKECFLTSSRNVLLSPSKLSPGTRQLLLDAMKGNWHYRQFQEGTNKPFPDGMESVLNSSGLGVEHLPRPLQGGDGSDQLTFYGGLGVGTPLGFCHIGYWRDPDSPVSKLASQYLLTGGASDKPDQSALDQLTEQEMAMWRAERKEFEKYSMIEPREEHSDEAYLHTIIKLKIPKPAEEEADNVRPQVITHVTCLQSVGEASGYSIVSDSFNRVGSYSGLSDGDKELQDILDTLTKAYDCNWEKHNSMFELHDKNWFKKRASQIPDDWIDAWVSILKRDGRLSLDEFAKICALDFNQIEENISGDRVLGNCAEPIWNLINNKALLCLYLRMNNFQQKMLFSEGGLESGALSPEQYQYMIGMFNYGNAIQGDAERFLSAAERGLILKAKEITGDNGTITGYQFTAAIEDGEAPFKWDVTLPTYKNKTDTAK